MTRSATKIEGFLNVYSSDFEKLEARLERTSDQILFRIIEYCHQIVRYREKARDHDRLEQSRISKEAWDALTQGEKS